MNENNFELFESDSFDLRSELEKYLFYWKWFVLGVLVSLSVAFFYLKSTLPIYSTTAKILIKDEDSGIGSELAAFEDLGLMGASKANIENEIEILKSRRLMKKSVEDLGLLSIVSEKEGLRELNLYGNSPMRVLFSNISNENFRDTIFNIRVQNDLEFDLLNEDQDYIASYQFGESITLPDFTVTFLPNSLQVSDQNRVLKISLSNVTTRSLGILQSLVVSQTGKKSNVLSVSLNSANGKFARDVINTLIQNYNKDAIQDKNQVALNTSKFIESRLLTITKDLSAVDQSVEDFKQTNLLTDISSEAGIFLSGSSEIEMRIFENLTQQNLVSELIIYTQEDSNDYNLLPVNLGFKDEGVNSILQEYNALVLDRKRIINASSDINPIIVNLNTRLDDLHSSILASLNSYNRTLGIELENLQRQESQFTNQISDIPEQERKYRDIERQQQVKEQLYLYLLQKREETAITLNTAVNKVKIVDSAYTNLSAIAPIKSFVRLGAILLGLFIPFVVIYIRDLLDSKIHNKEDLEKAVNAPILGSIPISEGKEYLIAQSDNRNSDAEAFRIVRTNLDFVLGDSLKKQNKIIVTSTVAGEGKSFVSLNVAATLAQSGNKTLVLGLDLRKPRVEQYSNISSGQGVVNYIMNKDLLVNDVLVSHPTVKNLSLISSGVIPPNPSELLRSKRLDSLFSELDQMDYDFIIIDTAPVSLVTDTLMVAKHADLTLYVSRAHYLDKRLLSIPKELYDSKRLPNMSLLLNGVDGKRGYGYGYGYGYGEQFDKLHKPWYKFW